MKLDIGTRVKIKNPIGYKEDQYKKRIGTVYSFDSKKEVLVQYDNGIRLCILISNLIII